MIRLGVVGHRGYEGLAPSLALLHELSEELGLAVSFEADLLAIAGGKLLEPDDHIDAMLTLGGDGTFLRGARFLNGRPVPILGINFGRLGFLTCAGPTEAEIAIRRLAEGDYVAEPRMTLEARAIDATGLVRRSWYALNDVVLHKGGFARVLHLTVYANGDEVAAYASDGVVLSTPTGSTAYNLSAGGPVVDPLFETILLTPIAPHTLATRPLVLAPTTDVVVKTDDGPDELLVTVDGQVGTTFSVGEQLSVRRAPHPVLLVRFPGTTFFSVLRRKLGWASHGDPDD